MKKINLERLPKFHKTRKLFSALLILYVFGSVVYSSMNAVQFIKSLRVDFKVTSVNAGN